MPCSARSSRCSWPRGRARRRFGTLPAILPVLAAFASGCGGPRLVVGEQSAMVRIGPDVSGRVYVWNGVDWVLSRNKVDLPEGWYCGPIDGDE